MSKYIFFTGASCSGCDVLKERIKEQDLYDRFVVVDAGDNPEIAASYQVRTLPTIISPEKDYFVGLSNGLALLKAMSLG